MAKSTLDRIREIQEQRSSGGKKQADPRFWKPEEYGSHVVRFLPAKTKGELFFVEFGEHWIEGEDGKRRPYICPRLTTNSKCPICETGFELFSTGDKSDESLAKSLMPRKAAYANVIVRGAGEDGEDIGPKIFKFGKQVGDKIVEECVDEEVDISDAQEGLDFKVVKKKVQEGTKTYPNYTSSKALTKSPTPFEDDELEELLEQAENIHELIHSEVKTYKELKAEFTKTLSGSDDAEDDSDDDDNSEETVSSSDWNEEDFLKKVNKAVNE